MGRDLAAGPRRGARRHQHDRAVRLARRGPDGAREPRDAGAALGLPGRAGARTRAEELLAAFDLADAGGKQVKAYSGGMRRRLDIAASLIVTPGVLFLDEPTTGLDPTARAGVWTLIKGLAQSGVTILLTTQYLEEADQLAGRIAVIDHGRKIAEGTSRELKAPDRVGRPARDAGRAGRPRPGGARAGPRGRRAGPPLGRGGRPVGAGGGRRRGPTRRSRRSWPRGSRSATSAWGSRASTRCSSP